MERTLAQEVRDLSEKIQFVTERWNDVLKAAADEMERPIKLSWTERVTALFTGTVVRK